MLALMTVEAGEISSGLDCTSLSRSEGVRRVEQPLAVVGKSPNEQLDEDRRGERF